MDGALGSKNSAYARAGVDIDAQDEALARIKRHVTSTVTPGVLSEVGSFGGLFALDVAGMEQPVLVSSADGVGTKLEVAKRAGNYGSMGIDLVNHCVNDILVQGAEPLFFLDYVGAGVLEPEAMEQLVSGVAAACRDNGMALLGGETAEMPGFYRPGDYELVGFIVGLVDRPRLLTGERIREGDILIGLPSSGLHTNGYSLARKVVFDELGLGVEDSFPGEDCTVGEILLAPHRSYLKALQPLLTEPDLHGLAHITGGGLVDNLPRVLPEGLGAAIDLGSWTPAPVFQTIAEAGEVGRDEMFRVFNMGIGMVAIVAAEFAGEALERLDGSWTAGRVTAGEGVVLVSDEVTSLTE